MREGPGEKARVVRAFGSVVLRRAVVAGVVAEGATRSTLGRALTALGLGWSCVVVDGGAELGGCVGLARGTGCAIVARSRGSGGTPAMGGCVADGEGVRRWRVRTVRVQPAFANPSHKSVFLHRPPPPHPRSGLYGGFEHVRGIYGGY